MKKWIFTVMLVLALSPALGCSKAPQGEAKVKSQAIQVKGSDTMVNLGQAWAEEFMARHPEASIAITGGGSGTGIAALVNGTCDIAQSSREMKQQEIVLAKVNGKDVREFKLAVIVHPSNPVKELSIDQLSDIFTGKTVNWKEVGGEDRPILALSRERNSGTHVYFLEHVVRKGNEKGPEQFAPSTLMLPSSQAIIEEVSQSQGAIGYDGMGYVTAQVKTLGVAKAAGGPFVRPTMATAMDKTYPLARPLLVYTAGDPQGLIKDLIDFILSDEGQKIVEVMDFVPLGKKA
ncbi:MAG: phosphate ABC transporter substrate-binding protein [Candidatus Omnitrophota bacterium]|jgi:phosphate transport system substrate-binding protein